MGTLKFAGSTLWNEAAGGLRLQSVMLQGARRDYVLEGLPGDEGLIAKDLGLSPESFAVVATYVLTTGQYATVRTAWDQRKGSYGTLALVSLETTTLTNCIMLDHTLMRSVPVGVVGGVNRIWMIAGTFQKLR